MKTNFEIISNFRFKQLPEEGQIPFMYQNHLIKSQQIPYQQDLHILMSLKKSTIAMAIQ